MNYVISLSLNFLNQWETQTVSFPRIQFEFKLHGIQELIGHFQWSVSSFSGCKILKLERKRRRGRRRGEEEKRKRKRKGKGRRNKGNGERKRREEEKKKREERRERRRERGREKNEERSSQGRTNKFLSLESQFISLDREKQQGGWKGRFKLSKDTACAVWTEMRGLRSSFSSTLEEQKWAPWRKEC